MILKVKFTHLLPLLILTTTIFCADQVPGENPASTPISMLTFMQQRIETINTLMDEFEQLKKDLEGPKSKEELSALDKELDELQYSLTNETGQNPRHLLRLSGLKAKMNALVYYYPNIPPNKWISLLQRLLQIGDHLNHKVIGDRALLSLQGIPHPEMLFMLYKEANPNIQENLDRTALATFCKETAGIREEILLQNNNADFLKKKAIWNNRAFLEHLIAYAEETNLNRKTARFKSCCTFLYHGENLYTTKSDTDEEKYNKLRFIKYLEPQNLTALQDLYETAQSEEAEKLLSHGIKGIFDTTKQSLDLSPEQKTNIKKLTGYYVGVIIPPSSDPARNLEFIEQAHKNANLVEEIEDEELDNEWGNFNLNILMENLKRKNTVMKNAINLLSSFNYSNKVPSLQDIIARRLVEQARGALCVIPTPMEALQPSTSS